MEKYVKAEMETIEFEAEDVISTNGCDMDGCVAVGCTGHTGGYA